MRCFCRFRWSCYGGGVDKSRLGGRSGQPSALANSASRGVNVRKRAGANLPALFAGLLAVFVLASCVHNGPWPGSPTPPSPPPPSTGQGPTSCSLGQDWCMGRCVDTISYTNDSSNCGRCGNHCSFSETCTGGFCTCGPGYESCMGSCVSSSSFISDSSNCGRCGNHCSIGESCIGGSCRKL